jgi:hypothetical protein
LIKEEETGKLHYRLGYVFRLVSRLIQETLNIGKLSGLNRSRGSSVSIVSGYGLDDPAIGVRSTAGAKDFSGSGTHLASCTMRTWGSFSRVKARPGPDADHSPHQVPRSRMSRSYSSSPPQAPPWRVAELLYFSGLNINEYEI